MKQIILAGFISLGLVSSAQAEMISFDPSSQTVGVGDSFSVDLVISGLVAGGAPSVNKFELDVSYDSSAVFATGVTFGPLLGNPSLFQAITVDDLSTPGLISLQETSLLSSTGLDALQPDTFVLATISFNALTSGESTLAFTHVVVGDAFGSNLQTTAETGSVTVVPEASSYAGLLGITCVSLLAYSWRHKRQQAV